MLFIKNKPGYTQKWPGIILSIWGLRRAVVFVGAWGFGVVFPFAVPIEPKAKRATVEQWRS